MVKPYDYPPAVICKDALGILAAPEAWTTHAVARRKDGLRAEVDAEDACRWCLSGAISLACVRRGVTGQETFRRVAYVIRKKTAWGQAQEPAFRYSYSCAENWIANFNDEGGRQFHEIRDVLVKAMRTDGGLDKPA